VQLRPSVAAQAKSGGECYLRALRSSWFFKRETGCQWEMLPCSSLPRCAVYFSVQKWSVNGSWATITGAFRRRVQVAIGRCARRADGVGFNTERA